MACSMVKAGLWEFKPGATRVGAARQGAKALVKSLSSFLGVSKFRYELQESL